MSESGSFEGMDLSARLEALLFVSPEPVTVTQLATALNVSPDSVEQGLSKLEELMLTRGLRLQHNHGKFQLTTAPEIADKVEHFLGLEATSHLSRAALETLAIVAYQQPVTRPQIDTVRGISSDGVIKSLLGKGLLQEIGRTDGPGRPILYGTTSDFLQHFGLNSLQELPHLGPLETDTNSPVQGSK
jgi:segregation and condensation protein B